MEFFVIIVNIIAKCSILDVLEVSGYILVIICLGYSADVLPWLHKSFNLRIFSIVP